MNDNFQTQANIPSALRVAAGDDRFGQPRGLGISIIAFKVPLQDTVPVQDTRRTGSGQQERKCL